MTATFVIVGASLAGAKAAEALRAGGFDGQLVLCGEEPERPYERPPLSKGYLLGDEDRDSVYVHPHQWYADHDVDLRLEARVTAVEPATRRVRLADGEELRYDRLLLATGASPRRLQVPGDDLEGVHYLRTAADSERLRAALRRCGNRAGRVVVVGAGWIGLEVAAAARTYGTEVTIIEPERTPLYRVLGPELGEVFADLHRSKGVRLLLDSAVTEFRGEAGSVRSVLTSGGEVLPADVVVVGVGVQPNAELAVGAGLTVDDGVRVDASLRSSDPNIYAAGDVAAVQSPLLGRRLRVEHWANALDGGAAAGRSMLGEDVSYDRVPYFFSDLYDLGMEYAGHTGPGEYDRVVYRGDKQGLEFVAFWLSGGRVVAGMNVNVWDVNDDIKALIRAGHPTDPDKLTDPAVPLSDLA